MKETLKQMVGRFCILDDWDVRWANGGPDRGKVFIHPKSNKALVHSWGKSTEEPADFRLHEVLHCALTALLRADRRKPKELRRLEEELVQDICQIWDEAATGKKLKCKGGKE